MARGGALIFFLLYLALGLYFLNFGIQFIKIPEIVSNVNRWIIFAGGVLLIFGAINFIRMNRYTSIRYNRR